MFIYIHITREFKNDFMPREHVIPRHTTNFDEFNSIGIFHRGGYVSDFPDTEFLLRRDSYYYYSPLLSRSIFFFQNVIRALL